MLQAKRVKEATKVQQQYKDEVDINNIVRKHVQNGQLPVGNMGVPMYIDTSGMPTFQEMMNITISAQQNFMKLPAKIRGRFENDPALLVEFISNEKNREEAVELGFIPEPEVPEKSVKEEVLDALHAAREDNTELIKAKNAQKTEDPRPRSSGEESGR